jgi:hypothetical protein
MYIRGKLAHIENIKYKTRIVVDFDEDLLHKITDFTDIDNGEIELRIEDSRTISSAQRKMVYANIKDIALYTGDNPEYIKEILKYNFCIETGLDYFSLSDCSVDLAREFITFLIDFILKHNIPLSDIGLNRASDIDAYLYSCLFYRRCAITGKANADIHHVTGSRVGMGHNRLKIDHRELELIALNREWHNKVHTEGETAIFEAYKVYGIKGDEKLLDKLGLNYEDIS